MTCNLDKYSNYEVKEVFTDGGRTLARLAHPPASCPDGVLNNSKTTVVENAKVDHPTLSFSAKLNAPVVLMPRHAEVQVRTDPLMVPKDTGIGWGWVFIVACVLALIVLFVRWINKEPDDDEGQRHIFPKDPNPTPPRENSRDFDRRFASPGVAGAAAPVASPSVVHHHHQHGGMGGDGLVTGMVLGSMLSGDRHSHDTTIIERETVIERPPPEPAPFSSDDEETKADSYSSDSDDSGSFSSDDSGSFSSDDSGSFGSDSSSDSGSSFGGD